MIINIDKLTTGTSPDTKVSARRDCKAFKTALIREYDIAILMSWVKDHKCNGSCGGFCALAAAAIQRRWQD